MPETPQEPRHKFSALTTLAAVLAAFLLAAAAWRWPCRIPAVPAP